MKKTPFAPLGCLLLLLAFSQAALAADTLARRSQARAREIVEAAAQAMGGAEALGALQTVHLRSTMDNSPRFQMPTVDPPHTPLHSQEDILYDLKGSRLFAEQAFHFPGFDGWNKIVIKNGEGQNFNLRARTVAPITAVAVNTPQWGHFYRRLPLLMVRDALARPLSLRYLGDDTFNGRPQHVVTYVHSDGSQLALYLDAATSLVSKYELMYPDALTGPEAAELVYGPYVTVGKFKVPAGMTQVLAGDVSTRWHYTVTFDETVTDATFEVAAAGFTPVPATPPSPSSVEKLGPGVYLVQNVATPFYNVLAVEFRDYILAVEAPNSTAATEAALKRIHETIPNKPIRYATFTHHHNDHMGGIRAFIAEGATIVTTAGNQKLVREYAAAKLSDSLAKNPKPANIELLQDRKRVFSDGEQLVELYDMGPTSHAREMLVVYLPKEKLLFQGDLFTAPFDDKIPVGPAQPLTVEFGAWLKKSGLEVERIAGVHGRTVTLSVLDASLKTESPTVPGGGSR